MTILRTSFVLAVPNLERSAAFYRDVLGFEIQEMGDPGWRLYVRDACRIMAGECPDAIPVAQLGDHSYFAYLVVDDIDRLHEKAAAAGAEVMKTLVSEPWGMREFGVRTVDGHRMMFGQPATQADCEARADMESAHTVPIGTSDRQAARRGIDSGV